MRLKISEQGKGKNMKTKTETLADAWRERNQLRAIAKKLRAQAVNLLSDADELAVNLLSDADELQADAASIWADALSKTGNTDFTCKYVQEKDDMEFHLETGEVFRP